MSVDVDSYAVHLVPGGTVGTSPQPSAAPWEFLRGYGNSMLAVLHVNANGTLQNTTLIPPNLFGWRALALTTAATQSRGLLIGGTAGASAVRVAPLASLFSGAVTGYPATQAGLWYMESDVRLQAVTGAAADLCFVLAPAYATVAVTNPFSFTNGFGIAWYNTAPNDNYRLFVTDASASVFQSIDTGVPALDGTVRLLRVEWGYDGGPVLRAKIDGATVATISGTLALNTAARLTAFYQNFAVGIDKLQASASNSIDAFFGAVIGVRMGRVS